MPYNLPKSFLALLLTFSIALVGILGFGFSAQALDLETEQYFIKQIKRDQILSVSPNFRGDLSQTSLLPSLTEISEKYHIKATKAIEAEKLNGKIVPGLIVYVEAKSSYIPSSVVANKP